MRDVGPGLELEIYAMELVQASEPPLRARDVHDCEPVRGSARWQHANHAQSDDARSRLQPQHLSGLQAKIVGSGARDENPVAFDQLEQHIAAFREQVRLHFARAERIESEQLDRFAAPGELSVDFDCWACGTDAFEPRNARVQRVGKARAGPSHEHVGLAGERAHREIELVRRTRVNKVHGDAQRDAKSDPQNRQHETSGMFAPRPAGDGMQDRPRCRERAHAAPGGNAR
jgi:hypothetical protein